MTVDVHPVGGYQLRVWLREISPAIWRRLWVRSDSTIEDLHYTLQLVMGWSDFHLHRFLIRGREYGVWRLYSPDFLDQADQVPLSRFNFRLNERFLYEYDFGDRWQHEVRVEKQLPLQEGRSTQRVSVGRGRFHRRTVAGRGATWRSGSGTHAGTSWIN